MSRRHDGADDPKQQQAFGGVGAWLTANARRKRAEAGLTQAELAERAGVSLQFINRLESAVELPNLTLRTLVAVATVLGCHPHELLTPVTRKAKRRAVGRPRRPTRTTRAR